ncbi:MAG: hypothetical protein PHS37_09725 [Candidatus Omnitrophica bacterium]|nr:hypothetical protein [Candidatus Omnitrophota bacterium]
MRPSGLIALFVIGLCPLCITGCETLTNTQGNDVTRAIGNFELTPTAPDSYWFDGTVYDYNRYKITITSEPTVGKVFLNGRQIGATPFEYEYTGKMEAGDYLTFNVVPFDEALKPRQKVINGSRPLPRAIAVNFSE